MSVWRPGLAKHTQCLLAKSRDTALSGNTKIAAHIFPMSLVILLLTVRLGPSPGLTQFK